MKALWYLILLAGLGGSLFLFFSSRDGGGEDMTLLGLGGAVLSFLLLVVTLIVGKMKSGRAKEVPVAK